MCASRRARATQRPLLGCLTGQWRCCKWHVYMLRQRLLCFICQAAGCKLQFQYRLCMSWHGMRLLGTQVVCHTVQRTPDVSTSFVCSQSRCCYFVTTSQFGRSAAGKVLQNGIARESMLLLQVWVGHSHAHLHVCSTSTSVNSCCLV
jgi:hypothetical protein